MLHLCDYLILALDYQLHGGRNSPRLSNSKCHTRELLCGGGKNKSLLLSQANKPFLSWESPCFSRVLLCHFPMLPRTPYASEVSPNHRPCPFPLSSVLLPVLLLPPGLSCFKHRPVCGSHLPLLSAPTVPCAPWVLGNLHWCPCDQKLERAEALLDASLYPLGTVQQPTPREKLEDVG